MLCKWTNCTAKPSNPDRTKRRLSRCPKSCVSGSIKKGQNVASYGSGGKKPVPSRIDHWSKNPRNRFATDRLGGGVCQRQRPAIDSYRRPSAIPSGNPADIWRDQAWPSKKRQRSIQISPAQTTGRFAGRRRQETSRRKRAFAERIEQGVVWQKEGYRKTYTKTGDWSNDQYLSYGTTQRHDPRPAGSFDQTDACRFSFAGNAAILDMAVAGFVQLDKGSLFAHGPNPCDGPGFGRRGLECFEIYFVSSSCQRPCTSGLDRAA